MFRVVIVIPMIGLAVSDTHAQKQKEKELPVSVKEIMIANHTKTGPLNRVGQAVKGGRWEEAKPLAQMLVRAGQDLAKVPPPAKGSQESWTKYVKLYQEDTQAILDAVEKKNSADFKEALDTLNASCRSCHSAHK